MFWKLLIIMFSMVICWFISGFLVLVFCILWIGCRLVFLLLLGLLVLCWLRLVKVLCG